MCPFNCAYAKRIIIGIAYKSNCEIDIYYRLRVLSSDPLRYGAATSQILAIYENFQAFAVSVLLLANSLF